MWNNNLPNNFVLRWLKPRSCQIKNSTFLQFFFFTWQCFTSCLATLESSNENLKHIVLFSASSGFDFYTLSLHKYVLLFIQIKKIENTVFSNYKALLPLLEEKTLIFEKILKELVLKEQFIRLNIKLKLYCYICPNKNIGNRKILFFFQIFNQIVPKTENPNFEGSLTLGKGFITSQNNTK